MSTKKFDGAIKVVLLHEGGYVNDPVDPGGETKYGITKRTYPKVDIKNLTVEQASEIYFNDWWLKGPYEQMVDAALATKVFDTAINVGASRAHRFLQEAANANGAKLTVDGAIGPLSIKAINALNGSALLQSYRTIQEQYYMNLIAAKPALKKFINGWIKRARS